MSTALVGIIDTQGNKITGKILLDSDSQSNFMSQRFATLLYTPKTRVNLPIVGINQTTIAITCLTKATIKSKFNNFQRNLSFLVIPQITDPILSLSIDRT